jgi:hypothetical protein
VDKYYERLNKQNDRQVQHHASDLPARQPVSISCISTRASLPLGSTLPKKLASMNFKLENLECYTTLDVNDFMQCCTIMERYCFIRDLKKGLTVPFQHWEFQKGGSRAGEAVHVIWRIPRNITLRCETTSMRLSLECAADVSLYQTRAQKTLFFATTMNPSFISSKVAAAALWHYITGGDHLPRDSTKARRDAIAVATLALDTQDFELVKDLRYLNGRPTSESFLPFWDRVGTLLAEYKRVDDRRHGACTSLFALAADFH